MGAEGGAMGEADRVRVSRSLKLAEPALHAALAVVVLAVLAGVIGLVAPRFPGRDELLATIGLLAGYTVAGAVAVLAFRRRGRVLLAACTVPMAVSLLVWVALIWFDAAMPWGFEELVVKVGVTFTVAAAVALYIGLIGVPRLLGTMVPLMRVASVACAVLAGVLAVLAIWFDPLQEQMTARAIGVLTVVAVGGLFASYAWAGLAMVRAKLGADSTLAASRVSVALTCPRCGAACSVESNRAGRCGSCQLRVRVEVEEPRCVCGYLLYQLAAEACPECGRAVPASERWHGGARAQV